ncbi:plexin-C1 [Pseudophryne corroboree]|uniref:plexin-C1 n=1 Tax=Pseudophryne corroboree TaxID=495146 RepID=UPI0030821578
MAAILPTSILFSLFISFVATEPEYSEGYFVFEHPINNIAAGRRHVIVATENCQYQFNHTLHKVKSSAASGENGNECMKKGDIGQTTTYYNKILLVYNDTVLSCWNENRGSCMERSIDGLKVLTDRTEGIVPCDRENAAVGLMLFINNLFYLIVARFTHPEQCQEKHPIEIRERASDGLYVTTGSGSHVLLKEDTKGLHFVDAFQWKKYLIFPYYPSISTVARLVVLTVNNLALEFQSQTNLICDREQQRGVILSSFAFTTSGGYFWAGIFATNKKVSPDRTALCVYNFTVLDREGTSWCIDHDFAVGQDSCTTFTDLLPIREKSTLIHGDLSAVYAMEVQKSLVFFLGTRKGQILKVTLNSNYTANCPEILYEFNQEAPVFRNILLDPIDNTYIYVATVHEMKRLKIATCDQHTSCNECLSMNDPHCGWCQSKKRCTMNTECEAFPALGNWIGISEEYDKCLGIHVFPADQRKVRITIRKHPSLLGKNAAWDCVIKNTETSETLCSQNTSSSMDCSCEFSAYSPSDSEIISVEAKSNSGTVSTQLQFKNCSQYSEFSCLECISSGCLWCTKDSSCNSPLTPLTECADYADEAKCKSIEDKTALSTPSNVSITSVMPSRVTSAGKKKVLIIGDNLMNLSRMFLSGTSNCKPQQVKVTMPLNNTHAYISLPQSRKEIKRLCAGFDQNCYQRDIFYESLPTCSVNFPNSVWLSGGRNVSISGINLDFIDNLTISGNTLHQRLNHLGNNTHRYFIAPELSEIIQNIRINLIIEEHAVNCGELLYKKNPTFTTFAVLYDIDGEIELRIKKKKDELHIQANEIQVLINYEDKIIICEVQNITENYDDNTILCKAKKNFTGQIDVYKMEVKVILGKFTTTLEKDSEISSLYLYILLIIPLLLIAVIAACLLTRHKSKQLSNKQRRQLEQLECEIRQEIRDGFAEFQIDKEVVTLDTLGTIPFFDYKHFALNTLFPESDGSRQDLCEKLCENTPSPFQARKTAEEEEIITSLKTIFENQGFMVLLIHTLEDQRDFSVKDRCMFASFLTINFQSNLLYLTGLLEILIKDLMELSSNKHPKLMLRRTETVVEKLLTNWMTTCLYGFLRESVGEPLYGLFHTLNQRIHKGPIDAVTCKALYTLNEDCLLWQITEFSNVEISVYFPTTSEDHQSEEYVSQCIKVTVLDCDTIEQVKEKILQTFQTVKGYTYGLPLCDMGLELHHGQTHKELSDTDDSTIIVENGLKRLNTIKHYKIENGATVKVISRKACGLRDTEYSTGYIHLESLESEDNGDLQNMENKGKQKFKVKELYLTKLLSTKVAIHSAVEKLFRSIWTIPHSKPPVAIKYFFDFLDTQGEIKKITDPEVLHIWKTNSLPLRFWVNILKNPQFVLDIKKTPLLDSCLSVITQAFMDGFSLAEQQLGKSAPTNKLLYAKDIPHYKEEVKAYYKEIRDAPPLSSTELTEFLTLESKKHEHEFKEDVAMLELYKYIDKYFNVIMTTLEKETGFDNELKQLLQLKKLIADRKKCSWE